MSNRPTRATMGFALAMCASVVVFAAYVSSRGWTPNPHVDTGVGLVAFAASTPGPDALPVPLHSNSPLRPQAGIQSASGASGLLDASPGWARTASSTEVWTDPSRGVRLATIPSGGLFELLGTGAGGRFYIRYPGDGLANPPGRGWIDGRAVNRVDKPTDDELPWAYPSTTEPGAVRLHVPYASQLDGTPWADANCGPTALGMALATFGIRTSTSQLRAQTLDAQGMWGDGAGTLLDALAQVASDHNLSPVGLWDGDKLKQWTVDDVRDQLLRGRPVIVQVRYRALPGRDEHPYWGDHYVVLTGVIRDAFLYNDPVDSDGIGFDRAMSSARLRDAMRTSDTRYSAAAFALTRP